MTDITRVLAVLGTVALLAGCGQYGPLYLPDKGGEVVTRPTQTPPAELPEPGETANSPQSVDSPSGPASPAPEVTEPEDGTKKDRKDGAHSPPPPEKNN